MNNITTEYGGGLFALAEEEHLEEELLLETRALSPLLTPEYLHLLIKVKHYLLLQKIILKTSS